MIAEPPVDAGAVKVTVTCALPRAAVPIVGAPGTVEGVTAFEALDAGLVPALLVAVTVKVYAVPLVSPVTLSGLVAPLAVRPPGAEVTV